jgi:hypothetical protein
MMKKFQVKISMRVLIGTYIGSKQSQHLCHVHVLSVYDLIENIEYYEHIEVCADEDNLGSVEMYHFIHKNIEADSHIQAIQKSLSIYLSEDDFTIVLDKPNSVAVVFDNNCLVSLSGIQLIH